jgi:hypothetical protein
MLPLILGLLLLTIIENVRKLCQIGNFFSKLVLCFKFDVCLTVHHKICLPVVSRLAIKLVNFILTNVNCCSCLFYKSSPLSDNNNNNKIQIVYAYLHRIPVRHDR